jgi:hypothetical protein
MPRPLPGDTYILEREREHHRENPFRVLKPDGRAISFTVASNCSKYDAFTYVSEMFGHAILVGLNFCPVEEAIACWDNLKEK